MSAAMMIVNVNFVDVRYRNSSVVEILIGNNGKESLVSDSFCVTTSSPTFVGKFFHFTIFHFNGY